MLKKWEILKIDIDKEENTSRNSEILLCTGVRDSGRLQGCADCLKMTFKKFPGLFLFETSMYTACGLRKLQGFHFVISVSGLVS
jgi:hypothetical protein